MKLVDVVNYHAKRHREDMEKIVSNQLGEIIPTTSQLDFVVKMPVGTEQYVNDVRRFVDAMLFKLAKNAHKGRWEEMSVYEAMVRIREETEELDGAVKTGNTIEMVLEAADIANFAMIACSITMERGK